MKKLIKIVSTTLLITVVTVLSATPLPASAHNMFLTYETNEIKVQVEFEGGSMAQEARVTVYDPSGAVYAEGVTDEDGNFTFKPGTMEGKWKISAEHSGHKKTVLMEGTDVQSGGGLEMPLYTRIIAGFGYLIGIAGIAMFIIGRRMKRERSR
jgi:nickel transport protein